MASSDKGRNAGQATFTKNPVAFAKRRTGSSTKSVVPPFTAAVFKIEFISQACMLSLINEKIAVRDSTKEAIKADKLFHEFSRKRMKRATTIYPSSRAPSFGLLVHDAAVRMPKRTAMAFVFHAR